LNKADCLLFLQSGNERNYRLLLNPMNIVVQSVLQYTSSIDHDINTCQKLMLGLCAA